LVQFVHGCSAPTLETARNLILEPFVDIRRWEEGGTSLSRATSHTLSCGFEMTGEAPRVGLVVCSEAT